MEGSSIELALDALIYIFEQGIVEILSYLFQDIKGTFNNSGFRMREYVKAWLNQSNLHRRHTDSCANVERPKLIVYGCPQWGLLWNHFVSGLLFKMRQCQVYSDNIFFFFTIHV